MGVLNAILGGLFDLLLWPVRGLGPWTGMIWISALTAVLMLSVFKWTSNQEGIRLCKSRIKAHLLEMRLFKDNLGASLRAQRDLLAVNGRYVLHNMKPMIVMLVPVVLVLVQLNLWFGARSLRPGETALVKVTFARGVDPVEMDLRLEASPEVAVDSPAVRIADEAETDWRIRAVGPGDGRLTFAFGGERLEVPVAVARPALSKIAVLRVRPSFPGQVLNPGQPPLPRSLPLRSIEVRYPEARLPLAGHEVHWLVAFFVLSIVFGFALKGVFKVDI